MGHEIHLFPLYIFPVAILSWGFGWKGVTISVVSAVCLWISASAQSGQEYSTEWFRYGNGAIFAMVYLAAGVFVLLLRRTLEANRRRMGAMRAMLNVCQGCGALQGGDGRWIAMDRLLAGDTPARNTECPVCSGNTGH